MVTARIDTLTERGAIALARQIREYWSRRGVQVEAWAEPVPTSQGLAIWGVRSNLNVCAARDPDPR